MPSQTRRYSNIQKKHGKKHPFSSNPFSSSTIQPLVSEETAYRERERERGRMRCFIPSFAEWRKYARPRFFKPSFHTIGSHEPRIERRYRTERGRKGKEKKIGNRENETKKTTGTLTGVRWKYYLDTLFRSVRSFQPILRFLHETTALKDSSSRMDFEGGCVQSEIHPIREYLEYWEYWGIV